MWGQPPAKEVLGVDCLGRDVNPPVPVGDFASHVVTAIAATESLAVAVVEGPASTVEVCAACREGGALLLCDTCPLAFHGACIPVPVDPDALPEVGRFRLVWGGEGRR